MVDIHCHILPETDDGAASWAVAREMCRIAADDGITHIVATPHANYEFSYDRARHEATLDHLRLENPALNFSLGCDFHFSFENVSDAMRDPQKYSIANGPYILVELSDFHLPPDLAMQISRLSDVGLTPIITHPERHPIIQRRRECVIDLVRSGCAVQVTADAMTGRWGKPAEATASWLLEHGLVHFLATDAHSTKSRPPILSAARQIVASKYGPEIAQFLVKDNPTAVIEGCALPYFPAPID